MTEADIIGLLRSRQRNCIFIEHLRMGVGYGSESNILPDSPCADPDCERTIDLFSFADIPSRGFVRTAFEIKISTSDFIRELSDSTKRRAAIRFANKYYFVAPEGIINLKKIPPECGLIEIVKNNYLKKIVKAPWHDNAPTWGFLASVLRRLTDSDKQGGE